MVALLFFGALEGAARLFGREVLRQAESPPPARQDGAPNLPGNPFLLWEMVPGDRQEEGVTATINSLGLRGPEWSVDKPDGVRRIVAVGDSSVYGFGVFDEQVFTAVLDARAGDAVQVINSAVPGYSTYQTINLLQIRTLALSPDVLLIGNLWSDNNFERWQDRDKMAAYGSWGNRASRLARSALELSAAFRFADYLLRVKPREPDPERVGWITQRDAEQGMTRRVEIGDYATNLQTMVELAHEHDAEVMFLLLANREDLLPTGQGMAAWDPYRQVMRDTAARHGAPLVDVPAAFAASGLSVDELFLDEMHPTATGHVQIADAVEAALLQRGWPDGAPLEVDPQTGALPSYLDPFQHEDEERKQREEGRTLPRLSGRIALDDFSAGTLQLDIFDAEVEQVVGMVRLPQPGAFSVDLSGRPRALRFVVFLDRDGNGPGPGDVRYTFGRPPLQLPAAGDVDDVLIDLDADDVIRAETTP